MKGQNEKQRNLILSKKTERKSLTFKAEEMKCRED
jgi:hypothetical protein